MGGKADPAPALTGRKESSGHDAPLQTSASDPANPHSADDPKGTGA